MSTGAAELLQDTGGTITDEAATAQGEIAARSPLALFWRRLRGDKVALVALGFIGLLIIIGFALGLANDYSRVWYGLWLMSAVPTVIATRAAAAGFLGDGGPAGVRAAYPGRTWDRLVAVKARYDPTNLFRRNQNIPPRAG